MCLSVKTFQASNFVQDDTLDGCIKSLRYATVDLHGNLSSGPLTTVGDVDELRLEISRRRRELDMGRSAHSIARQGIAG